MTRVAGKPRAEKPGGFCKIRSEASNGSWLQDSGYALDGLGLKAVLGLSKIAASGELLTVLQSHPNTHRFSPNQHMFHWFYCGRLRIRKSHTTKLKNSTELCFFSWLQSSAGFRPSTVKLNMNQTPAPSKNYQLVPKMASRAHQVQMEHPWTIGGCWL